MKKWVETKAVSKATEQNVSGFLFEEIFARYGAPRENILDVGAQFTSHSIATLMEKYGNKHRMASPYHPKAND